MSRCGTQGGRMLLWIHCESKLYDDVCSASLSVLQNRLRVRFFMPNRHSSRLSYSSAPFDPLRSQHSILEYLVRGRAKCGTRTSLFVEKLHCPKQRRSRAPSWRSCLLLSTSSTERVAIIPDMEPGSNLGRTKSLESQVMAPNNIGPEFGTTPLASRHAHSAPASERSHHSARSSRRVSRENMPLPSAPTSTPVSATTSEADSEGPRSIARLTVSYERPWGSWPDSSGLYAGPPFPKPRSSNFTGNEEMDFANSVTDWFDRDNIQGRHINDDELLGAGGLREQMWKQRRQDLIECWFIYEAVPGTPHWGLKGPVHPGAAFASDLKGKSLGIRTITFPVKTSEILDACKRRLGYKLGQGRDESSSSSSSDPIELNAIRLPPVQQSGRDAAAEVAQRIPTSSRAQEIRREVGSVNYSYSVVNIAKEEWGDSVDGRGRKT